MPDAIRVLYVAGDPGGADRVASRLDGHRDAFDVVTETTAADGAARLEREDVDCVVSGAEPDGADGLTFLRSVLDRWPNVPVLLFADGDGDAVSDALAAGVTDYVRDSSGGRYEVLAHRIRTAVEHARETSDRSGGGADDADGDGESDEGDAGDDDAIPRRHRRYERLVETVGDPMYVLDEDGTVEMVNEAFVRRFGFDPDAMTGTHFSAFVPNPDAVAERATNAVRDVLSDETDRESETFQFEGAYPDGTHGIAEANQSVVTDEDGRLDGVVGVLRDVTDRVEREAELRQYRRLVQTAADPMYRLDLHGTIQMVNDAMVEFLGFDRDEMVGADISEFLGEDAVADGERLIASLMADDALSTGRYEFTVRTADGRERYVEDKLTLVTDDDGAVVGTVGVVRDVTERKEREEELAQYETLVETVPIGLFALDEDGDIAWANEEFTEGLDLDDDAVPGTSFLDLVRAGYYDTAVVEEYLGYVRRLLSSETDDEKVSYDVTAHPPDGDDLIVEAHTALLPTDDGDFRGTVHAFRDITKRREYERQLERQNDQLERFASIVSHDLRNPINVGKGYLDLARENDDDAAELDEIGAALDRMETLVERLLELAKQGQTLGERTDVSVAAVARVAWSTVDTGDATLAMPSARTVRADEGRLRQLFENAFRNATEHGSTSPDAGDDRDDSLTVRVGALDGGFYVEDDGPGVPDEEKESIFDLGYTTAADGTGFGLGIVEQIVEAHGWSIRVVDGEDGGARFEVTGLADRSTPGDGEGARISTDERR